MKNFNIVATTQYGLENILAEELQRIGATEIDILHRAVKYSGDQELLYKSNLYLRTAIKILKPIASFVANNEQELYENIKTINWSEYIDTDNTFAIDATTSGEIFTHSKYIALKSKDAIADQFRENCGKRPSIDTENPDLKINIHIVNDECSVSLDSSGVPLGKRGYRAVQVFAPISEILAAGIILMSEWDKELLLLDPMCGSGTFAIEAALIAKNIPPGIFRNFGFEKWNDFNFKVWNTIKKQAKEDIKLRSTPIIASDIDSRAVQIARGNARIANVDNFIRFKRINFFETENTEKKGIIFINPPYGERMQEKEEIIPLYREIGRKLKHFYQGFDAWIISANLQAIKEIGLKPSKKIKLFNGPLECRLHKFEIY